MHAYAAPVAPSDRGARAASRSVSHSRHLRATLSAHYSLSHPVLLGKFPASRWSPAFFLCKVRMTTRPARSGFTISDPSTPLSFRQPNEPIDFSGEVAWPIAAAAAYHLECATPSLERGGEGGAGRSALRQRPWPRSPHTLGRTRGRTNGRTDRRARRRCRSRAAPAGLTHASKACLPPAALRRRPSLALPLPLSVCKNLLHRSQDRKRETEWEGEEARYGRSAVFTSEDRGRERERERLHPRLIRTCFRSAQE